MLKFDRNKFMNCLRIAIVPGWHEADRIESVKNFCVKHGFGNVMLFINAEEYNLGHMTIEEAKPWVETMKRAKKVLNAEGISVSVNPWIEWGHLDRGRKLKPGQDFTTMVDMNGKKTDMVACFYDENWRKYYLSFLEYLLREVQPDVYWIEDDFRLHNHGNLEYGGCFCDLHMQRYNAKLGTNYTREEFVKKVFSEGGLNPERKAWADVSREGILEIAEIIGKKIAEVSPDTDVALMSSAPSSHGLEARNWKGVLEALSQGKEKTNRIHLPAYAEISGKLYYHAFQSVSMVIRALGPEDTRILPELENATFNTFSKDSRFLRFQVESAIPLLISGMTYDIFDFVGNGAVEKFGYGEVLEDIYPYLQGIMDLKLSFGEMTGIVIPIDERAIYYRKYKNHWGDLAPYGEYVMGSFLAEAGFICKYSTEKQFRGKIVCLTGDNIQYFTDIQLKELFANNYIILEGGAVLELYNRGLGELALVEKAEFLEGDQDIQSYEQDEKGMNVNGIVGYRASAQKSLGDYVRITYAKPLDIYTKMYSSKFEYVGDGIVRAENFAVLPYVINRLLFEQFHDLRRTALWETLKKTPGDNPLVYSEYAAIVPYLFEEKNRYVLMLVNTTVNSFDHVNISLKNMAYRSVEEVGRDGEISPCRYEKTEQGIIIAEDFEFLSTKTLIFNK